jgi:hypothetical protein
MTPSVELPLVSKSKTPNSAFGDPWQSQHSSAISIDRPRTFFLVGEQKKDNLITMSDARSSKKDKAPRTVFFLGGAAHVWIGWERV